MYIITPETLKAKRHLVLFLFLYLIISFAIIFSTPSFIQSFSSMWNFHLQEWPFVAALIVMCTYYYITLYTTKIILDQDALQYNRMLTKYYINWDEISESTILCDWSGRTARFQWIFITTNSKKFKIPTHYFSKRDKQKIAETLINRCPQCETSDMVKRFAANDFPWYYF